MEKVAELNTLDDEVSHQLRSTSVSQSKEEFDRDRYELARAGKEQVLKRRFGLISMTGLSCGLMCTWESLIVTFYLGFQNGGPAGLIYGFLLIWLGNLSVFIVIGELSSAIPTAGGQYHWVSLLAPRASRRFFSYITGWLTVIGWIAALTAVSYFVVTLSVQVAQLHNINFQGQGWQETLLVWATLVLCVIINVFISGALPSIEVAVLIIHVLGFFGILVPLVYLTPSHNSAKYVFTTFNNSGDWSTPAMAFFIGLQGNALCFVGTDSAVHMSEEVRNASRDVARSMILSLFINGSLAFGMLIAVLFSAPKLEEMASLEMQFTILFESAVGSKTGASIMTSIIIILEFCSALGCLAAASRMTWSFARDRGTPFAHYLSMIDKRTTIPVVAILLVTICSAILAIINIGSGAAFSGIISLVLEGFYISYFLALSLLLWRRVRGDMSDPIISAIPNIAVENQSPASTDAGEYPLTWGPWRLKGPWGIANNIIACCYLLLLIFFSFWPYMVDVHHGAGMNWSVLVTGFVLLFSLGYYLIWARKSYNGPIVEIDVQTL